LVQIQIKRIGQVAERDHHHEHDRHEHEEDEERQPMTSRALSRSRRHGQHPERLHEVGERLAES